LPGSKSALIRPSPRIATHVAAIRCGWSVRRPTHRSAAPHAALATLPRARREQGSTGSRLRASRAHTA
jgi:hypothetical protein